MCPKSYKPYTTLCKKKNKSTLVPAPRFTITRVFFKPLLLRDSSSETQGGNSCTLCLS